MDFKAISPILFTPSDVLIRGFRYKAGLNKIENATDGHIKIFKQHFGSNPTQISLMWYDIITTPDLGLVPDDRTEKGFKKFLVAIHFLWAYPKNAALLASSFSISKRAVQGEPLWHWIKIISALKKTKIVWPEDEYTNPNSQIFIISVDGVDFRCWEKKHPSMPVDKGQYSQKFAHGALKYEIAIDAYSNRVVWVNGPFKGSMHDKTIYKLALRDKIPDGKKAVCDRVYSSKNDPAENVKLALPNFSDTKEVGNFKSRVRSRHETFNGRIKHFKALQDTYHHAQKNHKFVFEAICVMVIYQMENGNPLFTA